MAKYVNVDNFCEELNTFCDNSGFDWYVPKYDLVRVIEKHTVEAEPIRHGHWVKPKGSLWDIGTCSVCGEFSIEGEKALYCPHCGAKMYGE